MSTVRIPSAMRAATGGAKDIEISGATLREVIDGLVAAHPVLGAQLLDVNGQLNRFVNVFVNDTDARYLDALDTVVGATDRRPPAAGDVRRLTLPEGADIRARLALPSEGDRCVSELGRSGRTSEVPPRFGVTERPMAHPAAVPERTTDSPPSRRACSSCSAWPATRR